MAAANAEIARLIGVNIGQLRIQAGYSQEELGVRAGLHRTAVGQLERGERVPRADSIIRLAASLGIPPGDLLTGVSWEPIELSAGGYSFPGSEL
jgi:transcriptional regulator with XRE-family HTH domain